MYLHKEALEELKQIHFKKTGEQLSDKETLEMGIRITNLLRIIARKIPDKQS